MFVHLELIATEYRAGRLGTDQVMLLARVWANLRVQDAMKRRQKRFIKDARRLSFPRFRGRVLEWQRLADEDGAEPEREAVDRVRVLAAQERLVRGARRKEQGPDWLHLLGLDSAIHG